MKRNWARKDTEFLAEVARTRRREMSAALADDAGLSAEAEHKLAMLCIYLELDTTVEEFISEVRLIVSRLRGLRALNEASTPQDQVGRELRAVVKALRGLSDDARNQLASPLLWAWGPGESMDVTEEAVRAEAWLLKLTDSESLVDELARRADGIIARARRGRPKDQVRQYLAVSASALLTRCGAEVDSHRTGAYVVLLSILIKDAELEYDARAIAREFSRSRSD
jgi:hypothetical protein